MKLYRELQWENYGKQLLRWQSDTAKQLQVGFTLITFKLVKNKKHQINYQCIQYKCHKHTIKLYRRISIDICLEVVRNTNSTPKVRSSKRNCSGRAGGSKESNDLTSTAERSPASSKLLEEKWWEMSRSFHISIVSVCDSPANRVARGLDELIATSPAQARSKVLFSEHLQQKSGSWKKKTLLTQQVVHKYKL